LGAGIGSLEVETYGSYLFIRRKPPIHMYVAIRTEGPQEYPGGPNGPAAVLQDTRGGATWKHAVSQTRALRTQRFWTRSSAARPITSLCNALQFRVLRGNLVFGLRASYSAVDLLLEVGVRVASCTAQHVAVPMALYRIAVGAP
jgi:hypothetical protein